MAPSTNTKGYIPSPLSRPPLTQEDVKREAQEIRPGQGPEGSSNSAHLANDKNRAAHIRTTLNNQDPRRSALQQCFEELKNVPEHGDLLIRTIACIVFLVKGRSDLAQAARQMCTDLTDEKKRKVLGVLSFA